VIENSAYRDELVRRGLDNVERFGPEKIAQKYVDIYKNILAQKTKG